MTDYNNIIVQHWYSANMQEERCQNNNIPVSLT